MSNEDLKSAAAERLAAMSDVVPQEHIPGQAASDTPTDTGVKEDVTSDDIDDRGVPKDNYIRELERKLSKERDEKEAFMSRLDSIEEKLTKATQLGQDQVMSHLFGGQQVAQPQQFPQYNPYQAQAPQARQARYEEEDEGQTSTQQFLTKAEFARLQLKRSNDETTYQRYKDYLQDPNSPLVREVMNRRNRDVQYGIDVVNDPSWAANTVAAAYGDLVQGGQIDPRGTVKKADEANRRANVDDSTVPSGSRPTPPPTRSRVRLEESERGHKDYFEQLASSVLGKKLELSDDEYRASKNRLNRRRKR